MGGRFRLWTGYVAGAALTGVLGLAACGGGGGSSPGPRATATPAPGQASVGYLTQVSSGVFQGTVAGDDGTAAIISASTLDLSSVTSPPASDTLEVVLGAEAASSVARSHALGNASAASSLSTLFSGHRTTAQPPLHPISKRRVVGTPKLFALLHRAGHGAASARKPQSLPTGVGSTANIWTLVATGSGSGSSAVYEQVPSTLEYSGVHADIWVDNSLLTTLSSGTIAQISSDYDNSWSSDTLHVGTPDYAASSPGSSETSTPCNSAGQPISSATPAPVFIPDTTQRQAVFVISSITNNNYGSYFDPTNLVYQNVANCVPSGTGGVSESNEAAGIYLQWQAGSSSSASEPFQTGEEDIVLSAYDLTQLIDFVGHDIISASPPSYVATGGFTDDLFILNGMGLLSADFAINAEFPTVPVDVDENIYLASLYLDDPPAAGLTSFYGINSGSSGAVLGCNACFGVAYLFQRYAYDRFGGDTYLHSLVTSGKTGFGNLQQAFGGTTPQSVISDFAVAMLASGQDVTSDPRFNVSGFTTYANYVDQFGDSLQITGPSTLPSQASGTSDQYVETLGTFFYLPIGNPNGATIKESDVSGEFGLAAALEEF